MSARHGHWWNAVGTLPKGFPMLWLFVAMFFILLLAGAVAVYVAYPHRGEEVPHAPWLGEAMKKGVEALPTLDNQLAHQEQQATAAGHREGSHSRH